MDEDNRKALMEEIVRGREFAEQLLKVFVNNSTPNDQLLAQHLVNNLLNSFTNTLFLLDTKKQQAMSTPTNESQMQHLSFITSSAISSNQESSSKTSSSPGDQSNKRRKTTQTSSWESVSETPKDDGHQWRKYGQKIILNSKYTRNYYRCSHKLEQGCQATKQVQRIQEKPPLYKTIYYGHHICNNNSSIILDDPTSPHNNTSILLSFDNPTKQHYYYPFLSSSSSEDQLPSSSYQTHLTDQSSSTLESDHEDADMIYSLLCDSVELDHFFQTFVGFS